MSKKKKKQKAAKAIKNQRKKNIVQLVLPPEVASKSTLKLKADIEKLAAKIDRQNESIKLYLQDMNEPPEKVAEKLMRERSVLEVLQARFDQKRREFEQAQIADAENQYENLRKQAAKLQAEKMKAKKFTYERLCELYPLAEARRLMKDQNFRGQCLITAPILKAIDQNEQKLQKADQQVQALRDTFATRGQRKQAKTASNSGGKSSASSAAMGLETVVVA